MLAHASLAMQTAFSCLLVCLLEFYYRRVAPEAWLRWFASSWVAQGVYVAALWVTFDYPNLGIPLRVVTSVLGFVVPATFVLTSLALFHQRRPSTRWILSLYLAAFVAAAFTFAAGLPYPIDSVQVSRFHNAPRYLCYGVTSLMAAAVFARHGRFQRLTGWMVVAGAWAFFGLINLSRSWMWFKTTTWSLRAAENSPDLVMFSLITFVTNSLVGIVMSLGVGLLMTENAERSERRARKALRELQQAQAERGRLAQLVEQSSDAILVVTERRVRYLNTAAANLLGYGADDVPSLSTKSLQEVCGIAGEDPMATELDGAIASTGVWKGRSEWHNRNGGERIPVLVGAVCMDAREGEAASISLIGRDLREHLRLEEELRQAQRQEALGRLAGGMAHDFNNLLTVMMGYSSLALEGNLSEDLRQIIGEILTAARRAAAITDRLRAFGRRQALHAGGFELNTLVNSMRGTLGKLVEGDVELHYDLSPDALPVRADSAQIEQVLMNLVLNARQAIDGKGHITVRTAAADPKEAGAVRNFAKIEVEDTGSGIEPDVVEHIFDPYFTTRSAGTGLGLSMAYGIVRQSDGQIRVDSQLGQGSIFTVLLPMSAGDEAAGQTARHVIADATRGAEIIMVVDDRPDVAAFVRACLTHYGYRVISFTDSESALAAMQSGPNMPQLIVRDVMMPGISIKEFAERAHALHPGMPLVCMSGLPEISVAPMLEGTGGYFIPKPFAPEQLAAMVRRILDAAAILSRD